MMTTTKPINSTIARLDRIARRMGLDLQHPGVNRREFDALGKRYRYKPAGKGLVDVQVFDLSYHDASDLDCDAEIICSVDRVSALFMLATEARS